MLVSELARRLRGFGPDMEVVMMAQTDGQQMFKGEECPCIGYRTINWGVGSEVRADPWPEAPDNYEEAVVVIWGGN